MMSNFPRMMILAACGILQLGESHIDSSRMDRINDIYQRKFERFGPVDDENTSILIKTSFVSALVCSVQPVEPIFIFYEHRNINHIISLVLCCMATYRNHFLLKEVLNLYAEFLRNGNSYICSLSNQLCDISNDLRSIVMFAESLPSKMECVTSQ